MELELSELEAELLEVKDNLRSLVEDKIEAFELIIRGTGGLINHTR